jgi:hypothetical protein
MVSKRIGLFGLRKARIIMKTMMVMGDSLGQGCRNLTVTGEICSRAYGTLIAPRIGCGKLRTASYAGMPVLFDLLEELRRLDIDVAMYIPQLLSKVKDNMDFWAGDEWMQPVGTIHDNVSVTGANYEDLFVTTADGFRQKVITLGKLSALDLLKNSNLSELHRNITAMYAVNPCGDNAPQLWNKTAFDLVLDRKPDFLFVDIGHNSKDSGFFGSGADAIPLGTTGAFDPDLYVRRMTLVIKKLQQLNPAGAFTTQIFLSVLPKMSAVAALAPVGELDGTGYWDGYEPTLSTSTSFLNRGDMQALDKAVRKANNQVKALALAQIPQVKIIDAYAWFDSFDYKNSFAASKQIIVKDVKIAADKDPVDEVEVDNRYVEGLEVRTLKPGSSKPRDQWECEFLLGGFQGIDGMHPSAVGYAQLAISILEDPLKVNLSTAEKDAIFKDAFEGDTLLSNFPPNLSPVLGLLKLIRRGATESMNDDDDVPIGVAVSSLMQLFSRTGGTYAKKVLRLKQLKAGTRNGLRKKPRLPKTRVRKVPRS